MYNENVTYYQRYELSSKVLKAHGFNYLTSESCGYSMRVLFDIDSEARDILSSYFGGMVEFNNRAWNGRNGQLWSVMLPRDILEQLAVFVLLSVENYALVIVVSDESCKNAGVWPFVRCYKDINDFNQERDKLREIGYEWSAYYGDNPRNVHAFSGRES